MPNRTVLIGTFTDFKSIVSSSRKSVYTEVSVSVSYVFESANNDVAPGSAITVAVAGGSVRTEDGQVISCLTDPAEFFIQPRKKYLFVLSYNPKGQFYTVAKDWDLSTGVVKANSQSEQVRADKGRSSLIGLTEQNLIPTLQIELSESR